MRGLTELAMLDAAYSDTGTPCAGLSAESCTLCSGCFSASGACACRSVTGRLCAGVVAVLVRLLWPKMRKRSGRLGGKGAPGSARAAILNFFTALEPAELRPLLALLLAPIGSAIRSEPAPQSVRDRWLHDCGRAGLLDLPALRCSATAQN